MIPTFPVFTQSYARALITLKYKCREGIIFTIMIKYYYYIHPEKQKIFNRPYYVFLKGYLKYLLKHLQCK